MKKSKLLLICIMLLVVLAGCTEAEKNAGNSFTATVLEIKDASLLVEPVEGSPELRSADRIIVSTQEAAIIDVQNQEISIEKITAGKRVKISYSGGIAESYPAQLQGCYEIKLLD